LDLPGIHQVNAQGILLNVYSAGDIVSQSLTNSQSWEPAIIHQLSWAINQYKPNTVSVHSHISTSQRLLQAAVLLSVHVSMQMLLCA
jgi:hypothetical protein